MVSRSRNLKKNQHHPPNIKNLGYPIEKQGYQNDIKMHFPHVHQLFQLLSALLPKYLNHRSMKRSFQLFPNSKLT